MNNIWVTIW